MSPRRSRPPGCRRAAASTSDAEQHARASAPQPQGGGTEAPARGPRTRAARPRRSAQPCESSCSSFGTARGATSASISSPTFSVSPPDSRWVVVRPEASAVPTARLELAAAVHRRAQSRRRDPGDEPLLVLVDVLAQGRVARDDHGEVTVGPALHDQPGATVGDHGCRSGEEPVELVGLEERRCRCRPGWERRGAVLHEPAHVRGCRGLLHPAHQPVEPVAVGAEEYGDEWTGRCGHHHTCPTRREDGIQALLLGPLDQEQVTERPAQPSGEGPAVDAVEHLEVDRGGAERPVQPEERNRDPGPGADDHVGSEGPHRAPREARCCAARFFTLRVVGWCAHTTSSPAQLAGGVQRLERHPGAFVLLPPWAQGHQLGQVSTR